MVVVVATVIVVVRATLGISRLRMSPLSANLFRFRYTVPRLIVGCRRETSRIDLVCRWVALACLRLNIIVR